MNPSTTDAADTTHASDRATIATAPATRAELLALGVHAVHVDYDGDHDEGGFEELRCHDGAKLPEGVDIDVGGHLRQRVRRLFRALLVCRHSDWRSGEGSFGRFDWRLDDDTLAHKHSQRFIEYEDTYHEGFGSDPEPASNRSSSFHDPHP